MKNTWISVKDNHPVIKEYGESDVVLCVERKFGFSQNRTDTDGYLLASWDGKHWINESESCNDLEDNPDYFSIVYWMEIPACPDEKKSEDEIISAAEANKKAKEAKVFYEKQKVINQYKQIMIMMNHAIHDGFFSIDFDGEVFYENKNKLEAAGYTVNTYSSAAPPKTILGAKIFWSDTKTK
jgi:hypothetical protein